MKSIAVFLLALAAAVSPATAQETKSAKIEKLLGLINAQAVMDQMFGQIKSMTASMAPPGATAEQQAKAKEIQDKIMDVVKARMNWETLRPMYTKIYDSTFSEEEIDGMLSFYQTRAGRALLEKTPLLLSKTMEAVQGQMASLIPEIQRIAKEAAQK